MAHSASKQAVGQTKQLYIAATEVCNSAYVIVMAQQRGIHNKATPCDPI
jgi:hypothetical protein